MRSGPARARLFLVLVAAFPGIALWLPGTMLDAPH
jgi:hypothetical protein